MTKDLNEVKEMPKVNAIQTGANPTEVVFPTEVNNDNPFVDNVPTDFPNPFQAVVEEVAADQQAAQQEKPNHTTLPNDKPTKKIMDLFWLFNEKIVMQGAPLGNNEAQFVTISYNITFGNLRIGYHTLDNAIQGHVIFANKLRENTLGIGTLYPTNLFKMGVMGKGKFRCIEQLITKTDEPWQQNRPATDVERVIETDASGKITKDAFIITIHNRETGVSSWFEFNGWQKEALVHAARFVVTTGFELNGRNIIQTR